MPKIAIECDGAAFHTKEAYLYDKHRQKILEANGFVFHRIWSTNWWRNSKKEIEKLLQFIKKIESTNPSKFKTKKGKNLAGAFTDEVTIIRDELIPIKAVGNELKVNIVKGNIEEGKVIKPAKLTIQKNAKIKVKYLNNNKIITLHLTDKAVQKGDSSKRIQRINNQEPLALTLIGKSVGETIRVGNLDNYIEILAIL